MRVRRGGDPTAQVLVLLHGLGANGRVWDGVVDRLDDQWHWVVPDLPGHGGSAPARHYSFEGLAAAVAENLSGDRPVTILGHSLGGVVGLTMAAAARFGVPVSAVCGLGIKVRWSEQDLTRAAELAARPRRVFDDRQRAVEGALKVAGLSGLVSGESAVAAAGVVEVDDGWTLAFDPGAFAVGVPNMRGLLAAAQARSVILAAGELDPMCRLKDLLELQSDATVLAGLGHNAHVENPEALLPLIDRLGGLATRRR